MISVVLRAKSERAWIRPLPDRDPATAAADIDVVLVDNDSTDGTVEVAAAFGATLTNIAREEFSYGRALNIGIEAARREVVALLSSHCVPVDELWADYAFAHLGPEGDAATCGIYGRQEPLPDTSAIDRRDLWTTFRDERVRQRVDYFFHNANSAIPQVGLARPAIRREDPRRSGIASGDKRMIAAGLRASSTSPACGPTTSTASTRAATRRAAPSGRRGHQRSSAPEPAVSAAAGGHSGVVRGPPQHAAADGADPRPLQPGAHPRSAVADLPDSTVVVTTDDEAIRVMVDGFGEPCALAPADREAMSRHWPEVVQASDAEIVVVLEPTHPFRPRVGPTVPPTIWRRAIISTAWSACAGSPPICGGARWTARSCAVGGRRRP